MKSIQTSLKLCLSTVALLMFISLFSATALAAGRELLVSLVNTDGTLNNLRVKPGSAVNVDDTWDQAQFSVVNGHSVGLPVIPEKRNTVYLGVMVNDQFCYVKSVPLTSYRDEGVSYPAVLKSDVNFSFAGVYFDSSMDWLGGLTSDTIDKTVYEDWETEKYFDVKKNPFGCYYMIPSGEAGRFYTVQRMQYTNDGALNYSGCEIVQYGASASNTYASTWESDEWKNVTRRLILYSNSYHSGTTTITWKDTDGTVLHTQRFSNVAGIDDGTGHWIPTYGGPDMYGRGDSDYSYSFVGWTPTPASGSGDATYTAVYSKTPRQYQLTVARKCDNVTLGEPEVYTVTSGDAVDVQLDTYIKNYTPLKSGTERVTVQGGDLTYVVEYKERQIPLKIYARVNGEYRLSTGDRTYYMYWKGNGYGIYCEDKVWYNVRPEWRYADQVRTLNYTGAENWQIGLSLDSLSPRFSRSKTGFDPYKDIGYMVVDDIDDLAESYCLALNDPEFYTVTFSYPSDLADPDSPVINTTSIVAAGSSAKPPVSASGWGWDNGGYQNVTGPCTTHFVQGTMIEIPSAKTGLRYNGQIQTGVEAGEHYALSGETAVDAGNYVAIATPDEGYFWPDGSPAPRNISYTISRAQLTISGESQRVPYDGQSHTLTGLTWTGLTEGDGTVTGIQWSANGTELGTYRGTFEGVPRVIDAQGRDRTPNYSIYQSSGSLTIIQRDIADAIVSLAQTEYTYDGKAMTPEVTAVTLDGRMLSVGTDYDIAYSDNVNAGTAKVTLTGQGNYTGKVVATFTIQPEDISEACVLLSQTLYDYAAARIEPPILTVTLGNTILKNYTVTYEDNVEIGTGRAIVTGNGNYCGTAMTTFTIRSARRAAEPDTGNVVEWGAYATTSLAVERGHICLTQDASLTSPFSGYQTLYLDLRGHTLYANPLTTVETGKRLVLLDSVGGGKVMPPSNRQLTTGVNVKGTFDMYGGTITGYGPNGATSVYAPYCAVNVSEGGTFNMYGGVLRDNRTVYNRSGGAVYNDRGTVRIKGGEITGNEAGKGGAIYTERGGLYITGGTISGNNAFDDSGAIYYRKSYTYQEGIFEMTGGSISGNTAGRCGGGIYAYYCTFDMSGGEIANNSITGSNNPTGAGLMIMQGIANLSGSASITGNYFSPEANGCGFSGGGICNSFGTLNIGGQANISGNRIGKKNKNYAFVLNGAGISNSGILTIVGGVISENEGYDANGGGIYNSGTTTIYGGTIIGNRVECQYKYCGDGGGIYNTGILELNGGTIRDNTVTNAYGAIFSKEGGTFSMSGGVIIEDNTFGDGNSSIGPILPVVTGPLTGSISSGLAGNGATLVALPCVDYTLTAADGKAFVSEDGQEGFLREWDGQIYVGTEPKYTLTLIGARNDAPEAGSSFTAGTRVKLNAALNEGQTLLDWQTTDDERPIDGNDSTVEILIPDHEVTVTARVLDAITIAPQTYTGEPLAPSVEVVLNGVTLAEDVDYTLKWTDSTDVGMARVTVTSIAEPAWTASAIFEILPVEITVKGMTQEVEYDGEPESAGGIDIAGMGQDMALTGLSWSASGTDAGTYEGAFSGTATVPRAGADITSNCRITCIDGVLIIRPKALNGAVITPQGIYSYTGIPIRPDFTVKVGNRTLIPDVDFTARFDRNTDAGSGDIIIAGQGNFTGEAHGSFTIARISLAEAGMRFDRGPFLYTAENIKPQVEITLNDRTLEEGMDYVLTFIGNIDAGAATIRAEGIGNYKGTIQDHFDIIDPEILTTLELPKGLKRVDEQAFMGISAQRICVPEGCIQIGARAFSDCPALVIVELPASVEIIADNAFEDSRNVCVIAPANCTAAEWAVAHDVRCFLRINR